jgi:hypothetical protein
MVTTCRGGITAAVGTPTARSIVGDYPSAITIDGTAGTAYVSDAEGVSVLPLALPHGQSPELPAGHGFGDR